MHMRPIKIVYIFVSNFGEIYPLGKKMFFNKTEVQLASGQPKINLTVKTAFFLVKASSSKG